MIRVNNAKSSGYYFYMNTYILGDYQICVGVPLTVALIISKGSQENFLLLTSYLPYHVLRMEEPFKKLFDIKITK